MLVFLLVSNLCRNQGFNKNRLNHLVPRELTTFIFRDYNPYFGGLKPSFFMVLWSKGRYFMHNFFDMFD